SQSLSRGGESGRSGHQGGFRRGNRPRDQLLGADRPEGVPVTSGLGWGHHHGRLPPSPDRRRQHQDPWLRRGGPEPAPQRLRGTLVRSFEVGLFGLRPGAATEMHVGNVRSALFNWVFARHYGGTFVLRVEDTDAGRNLEESYQVLYDSLP